MGQIARISRAERFIDEFGKELVEKIREVCAIDPNTNIRFDEVSLGYDTSCGERVVGFVTIKSAADDTWVLQLGTPVFFDPEDDDLDDLAEGLADYLDNPNVDEIRKRLEKVD